MLMSVPWLCRCSLALSRGLEAGENERAKVTLASSGRRYSGCGGCWACETLPYANRTRNISSCLPDAIQCNIFPLKKDKSKKKSQIFVKKLGFSGRNFGFQVQICQFFGFPLVLLNYRFVKEYLALVIKK